MYEDLIDDLKTNFQPMVDVADINRKALEKLAALQSECLTECINASIKQVQALTEVNDAKAAAELQFKFIKDFEVKLTAAAEKNIATITEAKEAIGEVISSSYARLSENTPFGDLVEAAVVKPAAKKAPARAAAKPAAKAAAPAPKKAPAVKKAAPAAKKAEPAVKAAAPAAKKAAPAPKKAPVKKAPAAKKAAPAPAAKQAAPAPAAKKAAPAPAAKKAPAATPIAQVKPEAKPEVAAAPEAKPTSEA